MVTGTLSDCRCGAFAIIKRGVHKRLLCFVASGRECLVVLHLVHDARQRGEGEVGVISVVMCTMDLSHWLLM